ncbi:hypothetical protein CAEBREN_00365 [Caenorhabditis brenneri]|uniref:Uncharacterized protein n=1 Tax=Caenorhabditis brenneri TaxID=135651 RepID=G0MU85_CAEBE|nr:hypothetical protein CAEBREN_00365 [Caenorhabditis brenneri]
MTSKYLFSNFKFGHLPRPVGRKLWNQFDVLDLFLLAVTSEYTDWFSFAAVRTPIRFGIHFKSSTLEFHNKWKIQIDFADGKTFMWHLCSYKTITTAKLNLKIGKRVLPSRITEFVMGSDTDKEFQEIWQWDQLMKSQLLTVNRLNEWEVFRVLIEKRHKNDLKTEIQQIHCYEQTTLPLQDILSLNYFRGFININTLPVSDVLLFFKDIVTRDITVLKVGVPALKKKEVRDIIRGFQMKRFRPNIYNTFEGRLGVGRIHDRYKRYLCPKNFNCILMFYFIDEENEAERKCDRIYVEALYRSPDVQEPHNLNDLPEFFRE